MLDRLIQNLPEQFSLLSGVLNNLLKLEENPPIENKFLNDGFQDGCKNLINRLRTTGVRATYQGTEFPFFATLHSVMYHSICKIMACYHYPNKFLHVEQIATQYLNWNVFL